MTEPSMEIRLTVPDIGTTSMHTKARNVPDALVVPMLRKAIETIEAEIAGYENCPAHKAASADRPADQRVPVTDVIRGAMDAGLSSLAIVGTDADGELYVASTDQREVAHFLFGRAQVYLIDGVEDADDADDKNLEPGQ